MSTSRDNVLLQDVCWLQLSFVNFDLVCGAEYLLINDRQYCGNLNGQTGEKKCLKIHNLKVNET